MRSTLADISFQNQGKLTLLSCLPCTVGWQETRACSALVDSAHYLYWGRLSVGGQWKVTPTPIPRPDGLPVILFFLSGKQVKGQRSSLEMDKAKAYIFFWHIVLLHASTHVFHPKSPSFLCLYSERGLCLRLSTDVGIPSPPSFSQPLHLLTSYWRTLPARR